MKRLTAGVGVHVVYDSVGRTTFAKGLNCLARRGMMVLFGQSSGPVEPFDPQILNQKGSLFLTRPTLGHYTATRDELLERGRRGAEPRGRRLALGAHRPGIPPRAGGRCPAGARRAAHHRQGPAHPVSIGATAFTTEWLAERLGRARLRVLDASWYLPASGRDRPREYPAGHIPGALFFDLDAVSDPASSLPHMLPTPDAFARAMTELGLDDLDDLVVYDGTGANMSAARAWWMFRAFGHGAVAVLDGGMDKWRREGRPLEAGATWLPAGTVHRAARSRRHPDPRRRTGQPPERP